MNIGVSILLAAEQRELMKNGLTHTANPMTKTLYAQISESAFTHQVIQLARVLGWRVAHFRPAMTKRGRWVTAVQGDGAGFPDLIMLRKDRRIMAELKAAKGKTTEEQDRWLEAARCAGFEVYLWRPAMIDDIERSLR